MNTLDLRPIAVALRYLVNEGARTVQILQDVNQFGLALARAEACTLWIRDGEYVLVRENTAYPVCRTRTVPGARLRILESDRPGLTAYMAYQFLNRASEHEYFNLSAEAIRIHPAYRQADKDPQFNPYFPISKTSLSILCVPVRTHGEWIGMVKAENRIAEDGKPSGEEFDEVECAALIEYANVLGDILLPVIREEVWKQAGG